MKENEIHAAQSEVDESTRQLNQAIGNLEEKLRKGVDAIGKIVDTVSGAKVFAESVAADAYRAIDESGRLAERLADETTHLTTDFLSKAEQRLSRALSDRRIQLGLAALVIGAAGFQAGRQSRR